MIESLIGMNVFFLDRYWTISFVNKEDGSAILLDESNNEKTVLLTDLAEYHGKSLERGTFSDINEWQVVSDLLVEFD